MAGTSKLTKPVTARVPVDLVEWMDTQPGTTAEVVVRALQALKDGPPAASVIDGHLVPELQFQVASLTEALAKSCKVAQAWQNAAQALVPTAKGPTAKPIGHHQSGPVLPPTLNVRGEAKPMFRAGSEAEKALKSGAK